MKQKKSSVEAEKNKKTDKKRNSRIGLLVREMREKWQTKAIWLRYWNYILITEHDIFGASGETMARLIAQNGLTSFVNACKMKIIFVSSFLLFLYFLSPFRSFLRYFICFFLYPFIEFPICDCQKPCERWEKECVVDVVIALHLLLCNHFDVCFGISLFSIWHRARCMSWRLKLLCVCRRIIQPKWIRRK